MPKPVPIHSGQFERFGGWLELTVEQIAPTERGTVSSREHQSRWSGFGGQPSLPFMMSNKDRISRSWLVFQMTERCRGNLKKANTVHLSSTKRQFSRIGALSCLGLAACVFAWGLQYKLSLYDPPKAASHQVPQAKLLSKNEQSSADSPQVIRTKTSTKVIYTVPATILFPLLLALSALNPVAPGQQARSANESWRPRQRAFRDRLFGRPPPVLV
jgi:hypothetical protein